MRWVDWARAACIGHDTELWFADDRNTIGATEAKTICRSCSIRQDCLEYAIAAGEWHGIWGGESARSRRRIARERRRGGRRWVA